MKLDININVDIPEGVEIKLEGNVLTSKGPKGEVSRKFADPKINIEVKDKVTISCKCATKREKTIIGTTKSHIINMMQGSKSGFLYRLKVCSTHFPMTAAVNDDELTVQNFLGEKVPRVAKIRPGVTVKVEGEQITVESADKEAAGQTAASIEQLCRITNRDKRIFQDGVYITSKAEQNE